jgi:phosphoenolpyruvate---glycerone phosphotransferase subunit DhaL
MANLDIAGIKSLFIKLGEVMTGNKEFLCKLDAEVGDGDLGLTMSLGFTKTGEGLADLNETDAGKLLMRAGMIMSQHVPSTMGTLMASGLMEGGKALKGKTEIDAEGFALFIEKFRDALMMRGKAKPGEKTIIDAFEYSAKAAAKAADTTLEACADAAEKGALDGLEATKAMMSVHGKAAVFREKTVGRADPGATVGYIFIKTIAEFIRG